MPGFVDAGGRPFVAVRGRIYLAPLGEVGKKYWVCVSNNTRNRALGEFIAVRLTTASKPRIATVVELGPSDQPFTGRVVCDDLGPIYPDDVVEDSGALTPATMKRVDIALKIALGLNT